MPGCNHYSYFSCLCANFEFSFMHSEKMYFLSHLSFANSKWLHHLICPFQLTMPQVCVFLLLPTVFSSSSFLPISPASLFHHLDSRVTPFFLQFVGVSLFMLFRCHFILFPSHFITFSTFLWLFCFSSFSLLSAILLHSTR